MYKINSKTRRNIALQMLSELPGLRVACKESEKVAELAKRAANAKTLLTDAEKLSESSATRKAGASKGATVWHNGQTSKTSEYTIRRTGSQSAHTARIFHIGQADCTCGDHHNRQTACDHLRRAAKLEAASMDKALRAALAEFEAQIEEAELSRLAEKDAL